MTDNTGLEGTKAELLLLIADGLDLLARLHDREPDVALISGLRDNPVASWFGLFADQAKADEFDASIASLPLALDADILDDLAAEYADIYLTHGYRAAPSASVWLTEERAERQEPMFTVRKWYDHYGIKVPDWRIRADDHIVHELQFVVHLLRLGTPVANADAARFLDVNLLPWLSQFTQAALRNCRHRYFASSLELTEATVLSLREILADMTGIQITKAAGQIVQEADSAQYDRPFVPGVSASW